MRSFPLLLLLAAAACGRTGSVTIGAGLATQPAAQDAPAPHTSPATDTAPALDPFFFSNRGGEPVHLAGAAIVARDPVTGDLAYASLATCPGAGGIQVDGRAGVGIVALFGGAPLEWKAAGLARLASGASAEAVVKALVGEDPAAHKTAQLVVLDAQGRTAAHTGIHAANRAYHVLEPDVAAFGVNLTPADVAEQMLAAYKANLDLPMPERLLLALEGGHRAPLRGARPRTGVTDKMRPSIASVLLLLRAGAGYDAASDRLVDLRCDFHSEPLEQLRGLYRVWVEGVLGPRLRQTQRAIQDLQSPTYKANDAWLTRLRLRVPLGERR